MNTMTRGKTPYLIILALILGLIAVEAGAKSTSKINFETAITYLDQDDVRLCRKGAYALGELGDRRAISVLTAQLKSEDRHMRRIAAHALGKLGDKEAVMPLIEVLCNQDEDVQVQLAAVKSLGRLGDNRADRILAHLAGQESSRLQEEASIALKRLSSLLYAVYTVK